MSNSPRSSTKAWRVRTSKTVLERPWLTVRRQHLVLPTGAEIEEFHLIEGRDWVAVLALHLGTALIFGLAARNAVGAHPGAAMAFYALDLPAAVLLARVVSALPAGQLWTQVVLALSVGALAALPVLVLSLMASGLPARGLVTAALFAGLFVFVSSAYRRVVVRA